jgi:hypothetical protein
MRGALDALGRATVAVVLGVGMLVAPAHGAREAVARSPDCPRWPVTIDEIAKLTPEHAVACFGGTTLSFTAYVPPHPYGIGGTKDHDISPVWLDGLSGSFVALSAGPDAGALVLTFVPPALGRCDGSRSIPACPFRFYWGRSALVSAHFDGPVAHTCRVIWHDPGVSFTDADAVAECRRALIILSVGPLSPPATATWPVGCPPLPVDAATLIRLRDPRACYGRTSLTFDVFVPRTEGLGGVAPPVLPAWLDPWAGGFLQATGDLSGPAPGYGQGPFLGVAVPPALGACHVTYEEDPACPLAPHLNGWVRVSGHYDDPAALTCRVASTWPASIPRADTVAACRARFVLSAIGPATGLPPTAMLPPTSTAAPAPQGQLDPIALLGLVLGMAGLLGIWCRTATQSTVGERSRGRS